MPRQKSQKHKRFYDHIDEYHLYLFAGDLVWVSDFYEPCKQYETRSRS